MKHLIWLEVKSSYRRPAYWFLIALVVIIVFSTLPQGPGAPDFPLEAGELLSVVPATSRAPLASIGEWGRFVLHVTNSIAVCLFIGLLVVGSFSSELLHREVLWSINGSGKSTWAKLLGISFAAILAIVLGTGTSFFLPSVRKVFVCAGTEYLIAYLASAWIQIILWESAAMFLFFLSRSRWAALAYLALLKVGVELGAPFFAGTLKSVSIKLLLESYYSHQFVSPFLPLGFLPQTFFAQGAVEIGVVAVLFGCTFLIQRRFPERRGIKLTKVATSLAIGVALLVSGGGTIAWEIQEHTASFTLAELWRGKAKFDHPYIWTADGRLIFYPGRYAVLRLPPSVPIPLWAEELAKGKKVYRYTAGIITGPVDREDPELEGLLGSSQDLVLIYPPGSTYPPELTGAVQRFRHRIQPMVKRAALWQKKEPSIFMIGPYELLVDDAYEVPSGILTDTFVLLRGSFDRWPVAWALTASSKLDGIPRCYLSLYLMEGMDKNEVANAIEWLQSEAEGKSIKEEKKALAQLEQGKQDVMAGAGCSFGPGFCKYAWEKPEGAKSILDYWKQGETMGHEKFIHKLLEGAKH